MSQYFEAIGATLQRQAPRVQVPQKGFLKPHLSFVDIDKIVNANADLVDCNFRVWHCQVAYKIGRAKYFELASQARTGNQPKKLFSKLLKQAIS